MLFTFLKYNYIIPQYITVEINHKKVFIYFTLTMNYTFFYLAKKFIYHYI